MLLGLVVVVVAAGGGKALAVVGRPAVAAARCQATSRMLLLLPRINSDAAASLLAHSLAGNPGKK